MTVLPNPKTAVGEIDCAECRRLFIVLDNLDQLISLYRLPLADDAVDLFFLQGQDGSILSGCIAVTG